MLARKHYQLIASQVALVIESVRGDSTEAASLVRAGAVKVGLNLARALSSDNPAFDRRKFLNACSINPDL